MTQSLENLEVCVGGTVRSFSESHWREAVLYFLSAIWSGQVDGKTCITFKGVVLERNNTRKHYNGSGRSSWECSEYPGSDEYDAVCCGSDTVEQALVQFVKNNNKQTLTILFTPGMLLRLWKYPARGQLGICLLDTSTD